MDVVYLHRSHGADDELRYSLRSLANIPHDRVWLFGVAPSWVNVHHVYIKQGSDRFTNTTLALKAACEHRGVSDPFILMNDDFYIMEPLDDVPTLHLGLLAEVIVDYESRPGNKGSRYVKSMYDTKAMLEAMGVETPLSYETHTPLVIHKDTMLEAIELCTAAGLRGAHKRSVYGNLAFRGGLRIDDVKVYNDTCPIPDGAFLSSLETHLDRVESTLKKTFPEPCKHEGDTPREPRLTAVVTNHNYAEYLTRCIDSALKYCDEVLVYDDGSTDDSFDVLKAYGERITVVHRPDATGDPVWGSNHGIFDATGTHLIFLDADNYLVARPPLNDVDYTFAAIKVEGGGKPKTWKFADWPLTADECWAAFADRAEHNRKPMMPFPWGGVWRTAFLKDKKWRRFDTTAYAADCRTALDWCKARPTLAYDPKPFMVFVKHAGQWSTSPERGKMLAEAQEAALVESMPNPDIGGLSYPVPISRKKEPFEFNGRVWRGGDMLDRDTALAMKRAGFLNDPRIV